MLTQLQMQNNDLLAGNNSQNETIICWLDRIAHVLCGIKHNTDAEVKLQTYLADILELVHAREAMEVATHHGLKERIDKCCPDLVPKPQPCFEDCEAPTPPVYRPMKPDWKPIHFEQPEITRKD